MHTISMDSQAYYFGGTLVKIQHTQYLHSSDFPREVPGVLKTAAALSLCPRLVNSSKSAGKAPDSAPVKGPTAGWQIGCGTE